MTDLAIFYEHPSWFVPLFAALDRAGVAYSATPIGDHVFDPAATGVPAHVVFNRVAMSSFLRETEHPIFYAQALFGQFEGLGARVVNGTRALAIDASKARQLSLIAALGLQAPATRVVHRAADLVGAAADLRFPVVVKADIGGAGAGIVKYDAPAELAAAVADRSTPAGINGVTLVQEYSPRRGGKITRVETLAGKFLYAIDIESSGDTFDLCPADACAVGRPAISMTRVEPPPEMIAAAERIAQAAHLDVGGMEYLIDDRDGTARFFDINALSNFVADPVNVLGWDPHDDLVAYLQSVIAETKAS
ncbi:ATP-grasp domain-containing protein [Glacieibacterium frigidum]|uniref:Alpha-L-glutamate ligase n=1 Tax=Glacieibacterium frigidum TaxID=2593303 RepID=A0A552UHV4_9SPHN|nr:alpha-L-glutamate ligase [Glacieibacterium frigidum]TRW17777.1 alpha-L-glutamate ligase [Glacieibacterium frigidum]